jgi:hypothetical protein
MEAITYKEVRQVYKGNKRYKNQNKKLSFTKKSNSIELKGKKKSSVK